jgi:hypothetical protein
MSMSPRYDKALANHRCSAFRFAKKYFWFGEEPVHADNLREYLRGEKPEVAHPVVAWSSQTGKGLLFFVKHADQKEHPAGALNLVSLIVKIL